MPVLTVPTPTLSYETAAPGAALLENPVTVACGPVVLPGGGTLSLEQALVNGFFVYRQAAPAGAAMIWNAGVKAWQPDPGSSPAALSAAMQASGLKPEVLAFQEGQANPWQGLLVAVGQKDGAGGDVFTSAVGGFPAYFLRAYFEARPENGAPGDAGLSAPTPSFSLVSILELVRAGIRLGPNEKPENASQVVLFLKDAGLVDIGVVEIRASGGGAEVRIANQSGGALVRLLPGGDVEVRPSAGRSLIVGGPIRCETVEYQPANAGGVPVGGKKWLA